MENNIKNFKNIFAEDIVSQAFSHARVNLIGEHTDYTGGYVLPTLLPYKTSVYISENRNATYAVYSEFFKEKIEFNDFIKSKTNEWVDYVKGCLFVFFDENEKIKNNIYLQKKCMNCLNTISFNTNDCKLICETPFLNEIIPIANNIIFENSIDIQMDK